MAAFTKRTRNRAPYITASQRRRAGDARIGLALIVATSLAFAGLLAGAAYVDAAQASNRTMEG